MATDASTITRTTWRKNPRTGKWEPTTAAPYAGDYVESVAGDGTRQNSPILTQDTYQAARTPDGVAADPADNIRNTAMLQDIGTTRGMNSTPGAQVTRGYNTVKLAQSRSMREAARADSQRRVADAYSRAQESGMVTGAAPSPNMSAADADAYVRRMDTMRTQRESQMAPNAPRGIAGNATEYQKVTQDAFAARAAANPKVQAARAKVQQENAARVAKPMDAQARVAELSKMPGVNAVGVSESSGVTPSNQLQAKATARDSQGNWKPIADAVPEYKPIAAAQNRAQDAAVAGAAFRRNLQAQNTQDRKRKEIAAVSRKYRIGA